QRQTRAVQRTAADQIINLGNARTTITDLNDRPDFVIDDADAADRATRVTVAETAIDSLLAEGDDVAKTEALRLRGDLYRILARQAKLGDTFEEPAEYAELALLAYEAAISDASSATGVQAQQRIAARLGLAAAYEDLQRVDDARAQYTAVEEDPAATQYEKLVATQRLEMLDEIIGYRGMPAPNFATPATQPADEPATQPATQPAEVEDESDIPTE
ncbi:MAG: hypothetical protein AAF656_08240, partial [Planctomycetota bacterium]